MSIVNAYPNIMRTTTYPLYLLLSRKRAQAKLTLAQAGEALGIAAWKLHELERGYDVDLSAETADRVCKLYGLSIEALAVAGAQIHPSASNHVLPSPDLKK